MSTSPRTADELRAFVEQSLRGMSPKQQRRFWVLMSDHPGNDTARRVRALLMHTMRVMGGNLAGLAEHVAELGNENVALEKSLQKHRRPVRNAERDAEIVKLHAAGRNSGQIVIKLRDRWPELTAGAVRNVIRESRNQPVPDPEDVG